MNRLGDPQNSPIQKLMQTLFDQTSWDNPSLLNERLGKTQRGVVDWFKQTILRQAPSRVEVKRRCARGQMQCADGPDRPRVRGAGAHCDVARQQPDADGRLPRHAVGKVRTRFNQIRTQGDPGPAARTLMAATLEASGSELAEALGTSMNRCSSA